MHYEMTAVFLAVAVFGLLLELDTFYLRRRGTQPRSIGPFMAIVLGAIHVFVVLTGSVGAEATAGILLFVIIYAVFRLYEEKARKPDSNEDSESSDDESIPDSKEVST